jgi:hypothetical protein
VEVEGNMEYHQSQSHEEPVSKYSEEYFANRIIELQNNIKEHLPPSMDDSAAMQTFLDACRSVQAAVEAKTKAQDLLEDLQKKHADDESIQKAQTIVDACQQTLESVTTCVVSSGQAVLNELDLATLTEATLLECTVLVQSTPKSLADWVHGNPADNGPLIDVFLGNPDWMKQMIQSGGASKGNYGPAISIHSTLLLQIAKDDKPTKVRHKLALATALEHATPISVFKEEATCIDPIQRFWHYVHAFENGELDKAFSDFTVWELRFVVDSDATNDELQWGRDYLKAYRPDQILSDSDQWRYLWSVRTDVGYRQLEHPFNTYQELISAGGECGPRAFFGRFICKAFGTPTWGVRQPGHAALSRWTPADGWITCLGAAFKWSWWEDNRYRGDNKSKTRDGPDFLEETQARTKTCPTVYYRKMGLLECLADCLGETVSEQADPRKMWRSLSLVQRKLFAKQKKSRMRLFRECGTTDFPSCSEPADSSEKTKEEFQLDASSGSIIIPASAFVQPPKPTKSVIVMPSFLGGNQLHLEHDGSVEYELPSVIPGGSYNLSCRIVNIHQVQVPLLLTVDNDDEDDALVGIYNIEVDYTGGEWKTTKPIEIQVAPGGRLKFEREMNCHGLSIKKFTLESLATPHYTVYTVN